MFQWQVPPSYLPAYNGVQSTERQEKNSGLQQFYQKSISVLLRVSLACMNFISEASKMIMVLSLKFKTFPSAGRDEVNKYNLIKIFVGQFHHPELSFMGSNLIIQHVLLCL